MAENSKIEWTDHTFNPWMGCTKVSDGCKNCYAEEMMDRRYGKVQWGPQGQRVRTSAANWQKPLAWNRKAAAEGRRYRVFCASLADVFENREGLASWRNDLFHLIEKTPNLDWQLLTKRPENVMEMVGHDWYGEFPPNVWIGTSVENQAMADKRIPALLEIPAKVRFLSMEPLLGEVNLEDLAYEAAGPAWAGYNRLIDWIIVGGESGKNARPMHLDWVRAIRDQCVGAGVPFFFKQWGEWFLADGGMNGWGTWHGGKTIKDVYSFDICTHMVKVGKKHAGRLLDGREWNEIPELSENE